jgi:hypothetical protein
MLPFPYFCATRYPPYEKPHSAGRHCMTAAEQRIDMNKTRPSLALFLIFALANISPAGQVVANSHFDGNSWWAHVKFLADDSLEGRDTGSEGLRKAEAYAVDQFKKAGLEPAGSDGFYQPVRFKQYQVDEANSSQWRCDAPLLRGRRLRRNPHDPHLHHPYRPVGFCRLWPSNSRE